MNKKYKKLPNFVGIYKHTDSNKYRVEKRINGKYFSQTFKSLKEATYWRNTFNPFNSTQEKNDLDSMTFKKLWMKYEEIHFASVEKSTQGMKRQKISVFMDMIGDLKISKITPDFLDFVLREKKKEATSAPYSKRYNFHKPLDEIKAVFNWYKENYNYKFHNPVLKRHYSLGIIRKTKRKEKVLSREQLVNFIKAIDIPVYQDFAIVQLFSAGRFGEIAGSQQKNLNLIENFLIIKEVVVEDQSKKFLELKPYPKNGHTRTVSISSEMFRLAILRRLNDSVEGCGYLFHIDGKPLRYRHVQYRYNKALKKIGLFPDYSSTHFMRYTMATESRRVMGSLDAAQSVTGHHSVKMAEHYAKIPTKLQEETVSKVGESLTECWQRLESLPILSQ